MYGRPENGQKSTLHEKIRDCDMRGRRLTARTYKALVRLYVAVIALCVALVAIYLIFLTVVRCENRREAEHDLENYAAAASRAVANRMTGDIEMLEAISSVLCAAKEMEPFELLLMLEHISGNSEIMRIGCAAPDGGADMVDGTGTAFHTDFSQEKFFKEALKGRSAVQSAMEDIFSKKWIIRYAVPMKQPCGKLAAVLIAEDDISHLVKLMNLTIFGGSGYSNLVDASGRFVIRSASPLVSKKAESIFALGKISGENGPKLKEALTRDKKFIYYFRDEAGNSMCSILYPIGIAGWHIQCAVQERYVGQLFMLSGTCVTLLFIITFASFLFLIASFAKILRKEQSEMTLRAETDPMTGLLNKREFLARAEAQLGSDENSAVLAMIDIDNFKRINDRYGHVEGDRRICRAAKALKEAFSKSNAVTARFGGDEFLALLNGGGRGEMLSLVERFMQNYAAEQNGCADPSTCSAGIACAEGAVSPASLIEDADKALYQAKRSGKDRIAVFGDDQQSTGGPPVL